jgi:hypothetical protein
MKNAEPNGDQLSKEKINKKEQLEGQEDHDFVDNNGHDGLLMIDREERQMYRNQGSGQRTRSNSNTRGGGILEGILSYFFGRSIGVPLTRIIRQAKGGDPYYYDGYPYGG